VKLARALLFAGCSLLLLAVALRLAWIGDDACITLRTVENLVRGDGLRWNVADRVLINTHPAWTFVLAAGRWISGESYFTTIAIGIALSMVTVSLLLLRAAPSAVALVAVTVLLAGTRAFGDYSTSGLETPLSGLLLVLFARTVTAERAGPCFGRLVLLASLLVLTRVDLALLVAPAVLAGLRGAPFAGRLRIAALASLPLLLWLLFATIYFGSPLPVVAHSKAIAVGIPAWDLARQGLRYLAFAAGDDPLLLPAIGFGLLLGLRQARTRWLAFGALLYVGYVVKVGGDFMAGRFLVPPFVVATSVLAPWLAARATWVAGVVLAAAAVVASLRGVPDWLRSPASDVAPSEAQIHDQHGIVDERRVYFALYGLFAERRQPPQFGLLDQMVRPDGGPGWFLVSGAVGAPGFGAGPRGHLIDALLCDPLLARLPALHPRRWRIGHVLRRVPEGYYESLASGENRILHPGLRAYWEELRAVTRAPVFSAARWSAVWKLATGACDDGLRAFVAEHYYAPPRVTIAASELPPELPLGVYWFDEPRVRIVYEGGVAIRWEGPRTATTIRLQAFAGFHRYRCRFVRDGEVRAEALTAMPPPPAPAQWRRSVGLQALTLAVPPEAGAFDTLWIDAVNTPISHAAVGPTGLGAVELGN